jgi:hypothetical protein
VAVHRDDGFEWDEDKSADRFARSGFDFQAAKRVFESNRFVERWDEKHSESEDHFVATGLVESIFVSVVYTERRGRKRIVSAFKAEDDDIADYLVTYAIAEKP